MKKSNAWTAETIAIGSELLLGGRMDTNSLFIADRLAACGVELRYKSIVGDELADIVDVLKTAGGRARVVIITGGLGPTICAQSFDGGETTPWPLGPASSRPNSLQRSIKRA